MWIPWFGSLSSVNKVLKRLLAGDYSARVGYSDAHSFGALGAKVNQLAERFASTFQDLAKDRARLLTILTNMVEAVVAVDTQGRVLVINPAFARLFAVNEQQAVGRPLLEVLRHTRLNQLTEYVLKNRLET